MTDKEREALIARLDDCAAYHQRGDVNEHDTEVSQLCSDAAEALAAPAPPCEPCGHDTDIRLVSMCANCWREVALLAASRIPGKRGKGPRAAPAPTPNEEY